MSFSLRALPLILFYDAIVNIDAPEGTILLGLSVALSEKVLDVGLSKSPITIESRRGIQQLARFQIPILVVVVRITKVLL